MTSASTFSQANVRSVEQEIAFDLTKKGLIAFPALLLFGMLWGVNGIISVSFSFLLVLLNFQIAAWLMSWSARISPGFFMGVTLFSYLFRLILVGCALFLVKDASWVEVVPLATSLVVTHLGLLTVETHYVSASLAFPGLKPKRSYK